MINGVLFDTIDEHYKESLEDVVLIGCQHFLEGQYKMLTHLFDQNLSPENTYLIGKSYSFNKSIEEDLSKLGASIYTYDFDSHISFDRQFSKHLSKFVKQINKIADFNDKRVVILDDGGSLLNTTKNYFFQNVSGVEQTSSGYSRIRDIVSFPIVNVARSKTKLTVETPFIVDCFFENLHSYLSKNKLTQKKGLVLGGGPIGKEVQKQADFDAYIFDTDQEKNTLYEKELHRILPDFDIIIGASGNTSLQENDHKYLREGTVLASISSSDREFDAVHLRKKFTKSSDPHKDYFVNGIYLPNAGFPMTFNGSRVAVPTEKILLTQALMLGGIYESLQQTESKLFDVPVEVQQKLLKGYQ